MKSQIIPTFIANRFLIFVVGLAAVVTISGCRHKPHGEQRRLWRVCEDCVDGGSARPAASHRFPTAGLTVVDRCQPIHELASLHSHPQSQSQSQSHSHSDSPSPSRINSAEPSGLIVELKKMTSPVSVAALTTSVAPTHVHVKSREEASPTEMTSTRRIQQFKGSDDQPSLADLPVNSLEGNPPQVLNQSSTSEPLLAQLPTAKNDSSEIVSETIPGLDGKKLSTKMPATQQSTSVLSKVDTDVQIGSNDVALKTIDRSLDLELQRKIQEVHTQSSALASTPAHLAPSIAIPSLSHHSDSGDSAATPRSARLTDRYRVEIKETLIPVGPFESSEPSVAESAAGTFRQSPELTASPVPQFAKVSEFQESAEFSDRHQSRESSLPPLRLQLQDRGWPIHSAVNPVQRAYELKQQAGNERGFRSLVAEAEPDFGSAANIRNKPGMQMVGHRRHIAPDSIQHHLHEDIGASERSNWLLPQPSRIKSNLMLNATPHSDNIRMSPIVNMLPGSSRQPYNSIELREFLPNDGDIPIYDLPVSDTIRRLTVRPDENQSTIDR